MKKLTKIFFETSTAAAAKQLLGKYIVRRYKGEVITAKIVETEAYTGTDDPGSHACRKITPRNKIMFGPPGAAYVYFCYGSHYLFNIVTEKKGRPGAVLIRACEPVAGIGLMQRFRDQPLKNLTNGPGKLTQAIGIGRIHNGIDLLGNELYIAEGKKEEFAIKSGPRIGIKKGLEKNWRFWIKNSAYVSVMEKRGKNRINTGKKIKESA